VDFKEKQIGSEEQRVVLCTLAESIATPGCRILEIGSWCGDSSVVLGKIAKQNNGHLFCIDWWKGSEGTYQEEIADKGDVFAFFWDQICREGLEDVVVPIRGRSDVSSKILKENIFDMIFIDGDHRYENTLKDIQQYSPLVKDKGILCGHDCEGYISDYDIDFLQSGKSVDDHESVHCGVVLSVGSTFKQYSLNYSIWSVRANSKNDGWEPTNLVFPGLNNKKQLLPPPIGISKNYGIFRFGKQVYAIPRSLNNFDITKGEVYSHPEVIAAKTLQEIEGLINEKMTCAGIPELLESYNGYNFLKYKDRIYAISQSLGDLDLTCVEESQLKEYQKRGEFIIGDDIEGIKENIDQQLWKGLYEFVEEYKGFNIVLYNGKYCAVSQSLGGIDISQETEKNLKKYQKNNDFTVGASLHEVKTLIERLLHVTLQGRAKEMEEEINALRGISISFASLPIFLNSYKSYNFVQYKDRIYALSQALGQIDLAREDEQNMRRYQENNTCITAESLYEAKFLVNRFLYQGELETVSKELETVSKELETVSKELEVIKSTRFFRAIHWIKGKME